MSRMRRPGGWFVVLLAAASSGCVSSDIEVLQRTAPGDAIQPGESVVVLGRQRHGGTYTEHDFAQCVAEHLSDETIDVYPRERFADRMFPWFEPRTAPASPEAAVALLEDPAIAERLRGSGVRYLVWISGETRESDSGGGMSCAVGPGGGCLGFAWWEKLASYRAQAWNLQTGRSIGTVSLEATGTSYMPAVILPLPLLARTRDAACEGLADQLRELLTPHDAMRDQARRARLSSRRIPKMLPRNR